MTAQSTIRALRTAVRGGRLTRARLRDLEAQGLIYCEGRGVTLKIVGLTSAGEQALKGAA